MRAADPRAERRFEVLKAIVRTYVALGEPVGSRAIAGLPGCDVSPATVRHVMAELEELGLVAQPHTSAGRVPTDSGYRTFVELVLDERRAEGPPAEPESALPLDLVARASGGVPALLAEASRSLSRMSRCIGVVLYPVLGQERLRHVQFLRLDSVRVLVVLVNETGAVTDRIVSVGDEYRQEELSRISSYVVNRFGGWTLSEVVQTLETELADARAACDAELRSSLALARACIEECLGDEEVHLEGAVQCAEAPDFSDSERLRELLRAYEEKGRVARLLRTCLERAGVQIRIGAGGSGAEAGLPGLALVAAQYSADGRALGSIGVLGPTRMEYERVIAVVDRAARDLGRLLTSDYRETH